MSKTGRLQTCECQSDSILMRADLRASWIRIDVAVDTLCLNLNVSLALDCTVEWFICVGSTEFKAEA